MFDTMTLTKAIGGFCGMFLVFLFANWAAESIYSHGEGHGGAEAEHAYVIAEVSDAGSEAAEPAGPVDIMPLMAAADAAAGEKVFGKCKSCHNVDGTKKTGPALNGVVGRDIGGFPDFTYSEDLATLPGVWDEQHLSEFLTAPKTYAPGTKMPPSAAIKDPADRANLIAYLKTLAG